MNNFSAIPWREQVTFDEMVVMLGFKNRPLFTYTLSINTIPIINIFEVCKLYPVLYYAVNDEVFIYCIKSKFN
jgi:hypothetical protein